MNETIINGKVTIVSDKMFGCVLQDPDICKGVTERILGRKIAKISYPEGQKTIADFLTGKATRFDIYFEDDINKKYDVEMQTTDTQNLPKRTRYYHYQLDGHSLKVGEEYDNLSDSYIIFICTFDLFGAGLPVYTFRATCKEKPDILLDDGQTTVFVNLSCEDFSAIDNDLASMIKYMQKKEVTDDFTQSIDKRVEAVNQEDREAGGVMLTAEKKMQEEKQAILNQGIEQGIEQGIKIGTIRTLYVEAGWTVAQIASNQKLSQQEVRRILNECE